MGHVFARLFSLFCVCFTVPVLALGFTPVEALLCLPASLPIACGLCGLCGVGEESSNAEAS